jgi:hypothetical protein
MSRESISQKIRFDVFKRDRFACQYCGRRPPDVLLEVDHITPVCEDGGNEVENLVTSCFDCNRGKAGVPLTVIPKGLNERAEETREREAQIAGYREVMQARLDRIEDDMWRIADELFEDGSVNGVRRDRLQSIKIFNEKLPLEEVIDAAQIARAAKPFSDFQRFRYFCGVCWNKIKRNTGAAD